ncbi:hypothetical protein DVA86_20915 [Streptomyces armeniacus]|uniref:histidine kinase n=1 Tax=Streptomyces armeniacus TaxID=83291 RepID=A0A345XSY0_9ACTN|nr:hypothetical protein [Streptomyces armeniacus]AXK34746.1 hypothetical protein DVA86_20915 [Streptomyces armeniacus]
MKQQLSTLARWWQSLRAADAERLHDLADEARRAGQPVVMLLEGERGELDRDVELAVYRVAQEGLTNALQHARECSTKVRVRYGADRVDVEVSTAGPVAAAAEPGRGLIRLRERVSLLGGELRAEGRPEGGFVLEARIPSRGAQSRDAS